MDTSDLANRMKDYEISIFKGADRDYIDKLIFIESTV